MGNGETPAGEGLRRDPTGSVNDRGGLPVPPQESELFPTTPYSYLHRGPKSLSSSLQDIEDKLNEKRAYVEGEVRLISSAFTHELSNNRINHRPIFEDSL